MTVDVESIMSLARYAGAAIMQIYEAGETEVETKSDKSPLTQADRASNTIICEGLEKIDSTIPVVSEENKAIPYIKRRAFKRFWLVDPLDGTKEFIKRNGEFTVNIALIEEGKPIAGVVYVPFTREMFYATKGKGAFWKLDGAGGEMHVSSFSMKDRGLKVVCSRSHMNAETKEFIDRLNEPELVSRGSALKFMLIAAGDVQLYPRLAPTMEWDIAAAQCILEEAGGFVVDYHTWAPMMFNKESLVNQPFLAGGKIV